MLEHPQRTIEDLKHIVLDGCEYREAFAQLIQREDLTSEILFEIIQDCESYRIVLISEEKLLTMPDVNTFHLSWLINNAKNPQVKNEAKRQFFLRYCL